MATAKSMEVKREDLETVEQDEGAGVESCEREGKLQETLAPPTNPMVSALLTDMYQITMAYAYWKAGKHQDRAVYVVALRILVLTMVLGALRAVELLLFGVISLSHAFARFYARLHV